MDFTFSEMLSIVFVVIVISILLKKAPQINTFVLVIVGVIVGYVFLIITNTVLPKLNEVYNNWREFVMYNYSAKVDNMGYIHIYPPLFFVFVLFLVLLYYRY